MEKIKNVINDRSVLLAVSMEKNLNLQHGREKLIDAFLSFENGYGMINDSFHLCAESLKEIACLLTNPAFSSKLDSYSREHVGPNLLRMINFFEGISFDDDIENAYTHYKLTTGSDPTLEEIDWLEKAYANEFLKKSTK